MHRLPIKTKLTPSLRAPLLPLPLQRSSSAAVVYQRPTSSPTRSPNACGSDGPLSHPGDIYSPPARSMEMAQRCCRGVGGSPPPDAAPSLPSAAPSLALGDRALPTPMTMALLALIPHRRRQAKPGTIGGGARAPPLTVDSDPTAGFDRPGFLSPIL
jgi:hypothetical protein